MALRAEIIKCLNTQDRYRNQPQAYLDLVVKIAEKDGIPDHPATVRVFVKRLAEEGCLHENPDPLRVILDAFWNAPVGDQWGFQSTAAEEMLCNAIVEKGWMISVENLERVFPEVRSRLGASQEFIQHQRQVARAEKDRVDRPILTAQILKNYEDNMRAEIRRTGDVQKNIPAHMDRETARLSKLNIDQLRSEAAGLTVDNIRTIIENSRLKGLGVTDLRAEVEKQNQSQAYSVPTQTYGNNGNFKPLPPTYDGGKPWTTKLLYNLAPRELDRLMKLYGGPNLDKACAASRAKGIR